MQAPERERSSQAGLKIEAATWIFWGSAALAVALMLYLGLLA